MALIVSGTASAAYSRQDQPEEARRPFFLYVDEFHTITTSAFADMVSKLRKYGVGLVLRALQGYGGSRHEQPDRPNSLEILDFVFRYVHP